MKQVLQHARTGEISIADVPAPRVQPGCVLVRIAASLVSAGTERAASEFAGKSLLQKAKARPDLVREVVGKIRRDGLFSALQTVHTRLDQPLALGYSSAGTVISTGEGIRDLRPEDRVACAGAGYAVHAEFASVPRLLLARLSQDCSFEDAAFTTLGAVALHAIRTADVKLGDLVAVIGLGLVGQLSVQLLRAAGCRVLGLDILPTRAHLAAKLGATAASASLPEFRDLCFQHSQGLGADSVLITAESASSDPVNLAGQVARDRAVIVAVGTVGMHLERKNFYQKELDFRISRSYGPGRYDAAYEQKGCDYPIGYVRWTETRNMEAFAQLLAEQKLDLQSLITHRFPIVHAQSAYDLICGRSREPYMGVLVTYPECSSPTQRHEVLRFEGTHASPEQTPQCVSLGLLGAGAFAQSTFLPAISRLKEVKRIAICASTGVRAQHAAKKFGFAYCTTDENEIFADPDLTTVVIATPHHHHARQVIAGLQAGKHVFCEKPLCLTEDELRAIISAYHESTAQQPKLTVGFNRRFAPMALRMKSFAAEIREPMVMHYRVNAGSLPQNHWINDPEQGGGRVLGEVCHFVDFLTWLAGSAVNEVQARSLSLGQNSAENVMISLQFCNGSHGTISYLVNGDKSFSKERVELFGGGAVAVLDDFRRLELVRHGRKKTVRSPWRQDKGHRREWEIFARAICESCESPIPFHEIVATTLTTLRIMDSLAISDPVRVDLNTFMTSIRDANHAQECVAATR